MTIPTAAREASHRRPLHILAWKVTAPKLIEFSHWLNVRCQSFGRRQAWNGIFHLVITFVDVVKDDVAAFEFEIATYRKLHAFQGQLIPKFCATTVRLVVRLRYVSNATIGSAR